MHTKTSNGISRDSREVEGIPSDSDFADKTSVSEIPMEYKTSSVLFDSSLARFLTSKIWFSAITPRLDNMSMIFAIQIFSAGQIPVYRNTSRDVKKLSTQHITLCDISFNQNIP